MSLNFRFLEPGSAEFKELLYERLKQLVLGLREGLYTHNDLYYVVMSLVALGDLTREQTIAILKSPTLATLDKIFNKRTVREIETKIYGRLTLPDETPCLVVVPSREVASTYLKYYNFLTPLEKFDQNVEYAVCSVYKAISTLVNYGYMIRNVVILPDEHRTNIDFMTGYVRSKVVRAYVAIILLCRLWNINVVAPFAVQFDFEREQLRKSIEATGRVKALLAILDDLETTTGSKVVTIRTPVDLSEFLPAICVAFARKYNLREYYRLEKIVFDIAEMRDVDEQFYDLLIRVANPPDNVCLAGWWRYGIEDKPINNERYEFAKKLGFDDKTARKIAQWRAETINDIVRLLRDLRYNYRNDEYFRRSVVPRIAQIFNTRPEVLIQLLELDLL